MKTKKILFWGVVFLSSMLSLGTPAIDAGGPQAPPFTLHSLDGKQFTEKDLAGQATLIVFWASWCDVCQHELPKVHDLEARMKGKKFQAVAIGFKDTESNIRGFVASHPKLFNFPVLYDEGDRVAERFGARVTPTLFLIDQNGGLVIPYQGGGLLDHPKFKEILEKLV